MELFETNLIPVRTIADFFGGQLTEPEMMSPTGTGTTAPSQFPAGIVLERPRIIGGIAEGMTFRSAISGARIEILPETDMTIGMVIYDDVASEIFKVLVSGADVGDIIFGDSASYYMEWDKSAGSLKIVGPTVTNIQAGSEIAIQGWQHDMAFSATDHDTVAWASGTITLLDGTTYSISGENTDTMSAITYIYLDIAVSTTTLQTTTTPATAVGSGKILIAVAQNVASGNSAIFQVFGGKALGGIGKLIVASDIAANVITANEIYGNTLSVISADLGTITAGNITLDASGFIKGGQTAFNTGIGFFLGYDTDAYKFSIGNPAGNYLTWDGSILKVTGMLLGAAREAIVSDFQTNAGTGTATDPSYINDNDPTINITYFDAVDEYVIVDYGKVVCIRKFRYCDQGSAAHNGDGEWKIQYYNLATHAWVDWKTGVSTLTDPGWTEFETVTEITTDKIKVIATTLDTKGSENLINELEVIY